MLRQQLLFVEPVRRGLLLLGLAAAFTCTVAAQPTTDTSTNSVVEDSSRTVALANRQICTFRATVDGYSPEERAAAAKVRLEAVLSGAKSILVSTQVVPGGIQFNLDGRSLFILTPDDVFTIQGQTLESKAAAVAANLREALQDLHSLETPGEVFWAVGRALLGFVYFAALLWLIRRIKAWLLSHSAKFAAEKTKQVQQRGLRTAGLRSFVAVLRAVLNFGAYVVIASIVYALLWYELRCFPYSRPWGDYLRNQCLSALASLGNSILASLPDFMIIAFIVLAVRLVVHVLTQLFAVAERGEFQTRLVDPVIAATTRRIVVCMIWVVAIVVAYPYIPGSQSLAFKGVSVFAGLVLSLGSTNLINQIASGLVLIYSRAYRVGDYVRVAETEGTVVDIGLCVTRIRTIKNEEVHIANSVLLGAATTNYSRLSKTDGVYLSVRVTIGYSTPWRQVQAMLLEAARRTQGLLSTPPPFVLQVSLADFYVQYELNVRLEIPERRVWVLSDLQSHIQDIFNEHGVQIMSPHYLSDPPQPHVVPKSRWFLPPATDSATSESPAIQRDTQTLQSEPRQARP
jgi:small-conductance mechanosensitive channel